MDILRTIRLFESTDQTMVTWLTPIWVLAVGMLLGLLLAGVLFGLLYLLLTALAGASPTFVRRREMLVDSLLQGPLFFATLIFGVFAIFSYLGLAFVDDPDAVIASLSRCIACGICDAHFGGYENVARTAMRAPSDVVLAHTRSLPDWDALAAPLAQLERGDLARIERLCPAQIPLSRVVEVAKRRAEALRAADPKSAALALSRGKHDPG